MWWSYLKSFKFLTIKYDVSCTFLISIKLKTFPSIASLLRVFKIYFSWRIIALQFCVGFCHTSTWISHMYTYVSSQEFFVKSWMSVEFCRIPFLYPLIWSCSFSLRVCWCDGLNKFIFKCWLSLVYLEQIPFGHAIQLILFIHCWVWFVNILLRSLTSINMFNMFMRDNWSVAFLSYNIFGFGIRVMLAS